jgi:type II secretory pathway component PulK
MPSMSNRHRGAVLLLVIAAVTLLAVLAVELASRASVQSMQTARASRDAAFRRLFDSATEVATGILAESEPKAYDFWGDPWNREVRLGLGEGEQVVFRMADESGKICIGSGAGGPDATTAQGDMLARLFEHLRKSRDSGRPGAWDEASLKVYQRLGLAWVEGKLVRSFESPPMVTLDNLREVGLSLDNVFGEAGLSRYLTVFGDGKVNINTASPSVLYALVEDFDQAIVDRIVQQRGGSYGEPSKYTPFKDPVELKGIEGVIVKEIVNGQTRVTRDLYEKVRDRITVMSSCFSVKIEAQAAGRTRRAWAFFETTAPPPNDGTIKQGVRRLAFEVLEQ